MNTQEMREQRARLANEARAVLDTARTEKRDLTSEENETVTRIHGEIDRLKSIVDIAERQVSIDTELSGSTRRIGGEAGESRTADSANTLRSWLLAGSNIAPSADETRAALDAGVDIRNRNFSFKLGPAPRTMDEVRALSSITGSAGGHTVPDDTMRAIESALLSFGGMRQVATVIRSSTGAPLPIPTSNDTNQKGVILAQNAQAAEQDVAFGTVSLGSFKYSSKMIRVPVELLQDSSINVAQFVGSALGERLARATNEHYTVGTGTAQPWGIVPRSTEGHEAASATAISYNDLVTLEHSVDPAYRANAVWMFNDSTLAQLKKLVDENGRPLWMPGLTTAAPDRILGYAFVSNSDVAPIATGAKAIVFGALSKYMIRDVAEIQLVRLDERFADFHQVAFLAFYRGDGNLIDAGSNPVKHLVMG